MSEISLEDCDSWSCLSSVTSVSPVTTHVFIVENFDEVLKESKKGIDLDSSLFEIEDTKWKINVCIEFEDPIFEDEEDQEFVGIYLVNLNSKIHYVKWTITCCGLTRKFQDSVEVRPGDGYGRGFPNFIRRDDCLKKLVDKKLFVKAEVSVVRKGPASIVAGKGMKEKKENVGASKLMESIYNSMIYSDFKLVSNGREFECHKNFIAGQSETFQNVLESPWVSDGMMFMDEYRPEVVEGLLSHCYRSPLKQDVFEANVVEYLNIAEKYDLPDLKVKAEIFMISNMKKETLIEFIVAADLFNATKVKESALKFLSSNKNLWMENIKEWKENLKGKEELLMEIITAITACS